MDWDDKMGLRLKVRFVRYRNVILRMLLTPWKGILSGNIYVLRIDGGICSQINQYIQGKYLEEQGHRVIYNLDWYQKNGMDLNGKYPRNYELEKLRERNFDLVKRIIIDVFNKQFQDCITYIFHYGSHSTKTYLKNADIDLTILLESKEDKNIITEMSIEIIDEMMNLIKEEFERYNKQIGFEFISDIKIINADIRLLKCKIGNISIDISVNNFSGIYKVIFIDYIENQFKNAFNRLNLFNDNSFSENKIQIFRRTLILIKAWCSFEGNLMGSNIGLMASYALEILVIYVFNVHYDNIYNEFDGFEKFFELMDKFDWQKSVISLFGIFSKVDYQKKLVNYNNLNRNNSSKSGNKNSNINNNKNEPFWYLLYKKGNENNSGKDIYTMKRIDENLDEDEYTKEPLLKLNEIKKLILPINKGMGNIYLKREGNIINGTNFEKLINILDPMNIHNNLGKSISFHSKSKMKKIISYMNKQFKYIQKIRKKGNPFLYMNSLLNLFKTTLTTTYIELFINYMNSPRLISNSQLIKKFKKDKDKKRLNITIDEIHKFNNLFVSEKMNPNLNFIDEEENDKCVEDSEKSSDFEEEKIEKNFEDDFEEDEYAEEEEEENYELAEDNKIEGKDDKREKIKFVPLINSKVIEKLIELYENKQNIINFNNDLLKKSTDYSNNLEKLLKENKLI